MPMEDPLLTIEEAASYLNVSKTSLRRWTTSGKLPCVRVGLRNERRFQRSVLEGFVSRTRGVAAKVPSWLPGAYAPPAANRPPVVASGEFDAVRHLALYFHDREELWRLFRPIVAEHVTSAAPVLYIHDEGARDQVLGWFRGEGWDPESLLRRGLLKLLVPAETYLRTGRFVPQRMIDFVEAQILSWRADGHDQMLVSGEMSWFLSGAPGCEGMYEYECNLNAMYRRYPKVTAVCHYDLHRLSGAVAIGGFCSHPHVLLPEHSMAGYLHAMR